MPRLSTERLWEKARGVAHRTWAAVPRDRSRVGQRGSQSRGAEEQRGIGGGLFFRSFLLAGQKKWTRGAGTESPQVAVHNAHEVRTKHHSRTECTRKFTSTPGPSE